MWRPEDRVCGAFHKFILIFLEAKKREKRNKNFKNTTQWKDVNFNKNTESIKFSNPPPSIPTEVDCNTYRFH